MPTTRSNRRTTCVLLSAFALIIQPDFANGNEIEFARDVAPILSSHCFQCHGPDENSRKGDLRLDQIGEVVSRSEVDDTLINPGKPDASELIKRVASDDSDVRMPPPEHGAALSREQIDVLRRWIASGASYDRHWSFVPPVRPLLPPVAKTSWPRTPIDRFVLAELEDRGLSPSSVADQYTLLRRVSLDLVGLPPTIRQVGQFVRDESSDRWERLVDRLLASPQYGERMAQSWLDAARYADTTGHAADKPRTMWLFREWVIDAFNDNMPFDQFTIEQLAGDMLPNPTESQFVATGFHRNSKQALGNNPRKEEFRVKGIVDRLDTTGRVWFGITIGCAECHDHKFDPISQRDYYRLFAIFNNIPHLGEKFEIHGPRLEVLPKLVQQKISAIERRNDVESHRLIEELQKQSVTAQTMAEMTPARSTFIHVRGNFEDPGDEVKPGIPATIATSPNGQVNRLEFARAIVGRDNPLSARVAVNRIWQHYFGTGLVRTVDDFGIRGDLPSHPQLLDWLAVEFMESGWDTKHMHRLIVTSATYRQASDTSSRLQSIDPKNRLLGRGPRVRLDAEQIRDMAVFATGKFQGEIGGPSVFPVQDSSIGQFRDETAGVWVESPGEGQYRRAIYTFWQRMSPYPSAVMFDASSRERCVVDRPKTNTPMQSLTMLNDPYFVMLARDFGKRIEESAATTEARIEFAFHAVLSRPPDDDEVRRFVTYVDSISANHDEADQEFVWFRIAQVLLNLDEAMTKE